MASCPSDLPHQEGQQAHQRIDTAVPLSLPRYMEATFYPQNWLEKALPKPTTLLVLEANSPYTNHSLGNYMYFCSFYNNQEYFFFF